MASGQDKGSAEERVFQYYQKFSQNKNLPKYFSGTSVSYLPQFNENIEERDEPETILINTDVDVIITTIERDEKPPEEDTSRASSAMSSRKLEWDNLADIGYENSQQLIALKKSSSLPILSDLKEKKVDFNLQAKSSKTSQSDGNEDNVHVIILSYSSSSEGENPQVDLSSSSSSSLADERKPIMSSTTTSSTNELKKLPSSSSDTSSKQDVESFAKSLSFLKKKIGLPGAQSTPTSFEGTGSTGRSKDISVSKKSTNISKVIDAMTALGAQSTSKDIKTSTKNADLLKSTTTEVKGGNSNVKNPKRLSKHTIESIDLKPTESKDSKQSSSTQSQKRVIYLCATKPLSIECICEQQPLEIKKVQTGTDCRSTAVQTDDISEKELVEIVSGALRNPNQAIMLFEHVSSDRNTCSTQTGSSDIAVDSFEYIKNSNREGEEEVEKKSEPTSSDEACLANVISSNNLENYSDDLEKKIYLVHRLIKSEKYDDATKKRYIKRIIKKITESKYLEDSSTSSDLFLPKKSSKPPIENLPMQTSSTNSSSMSSQRGILKKPRSPRKKLEIVTVSDEIIEAASRKHHQIHSRQDSTDTSMKKQYDSSSSSRSLGYQNWKEDKTLSEKRLEERTTSNGSGDYLIHAVDKERQYQLNWISSEMDHLSKLKCLLEKHVSREIKPIQTSKTVYVVSDSDGSSNRKKFVIQTNNTRNSNKGSKRVFRLEGRKYTVDDLSEENPHSSQPVLKDIEVTSTDNTMNIKVTTFCEVCKRLPCVCITEFLECLRNPFESEMIKENSCSACTSYPCRCSSKSICIKCHKAVCICSKGAIPKMCSVCGSYPCKCGYGRSIPEDYEGKFVPANVPEKIIRKMGESSKSGSVYGSSKSSGKSAVSNRIPMDDNSLKKIFNYCKCNLQKECNCGFVDKVYKHFTFPGNSRTCQTDLQQSDPPVQTTSEDIQTDRSLGKNIAVQVGAKVTDQNIQTVEEQHLKEIMDKFTETYLEYRRASTQTEQREVCACASIQTEEVVILDQPVPISEADVQTEVPLLISREQSPENILQTHVTSQTVDVVTSNKNPQTERKTKDVACTCEQKRHPKSKKITQTELPKVTSKVQSTENVAYINSHAQTSKNAGQDKIIETEKELRNVECMCKHPIRHNRETSQNILSKDQFTGNILISDKSKVDAAFQDQIIETEKEFTSTGSQSLSKTTGKTVRRSLSKEQFTEDFLTNDYIQAHIPPEYQNIETDQAHVPVQHRNQIEEFRSATKVVQTDRRPLSKEQFTESAFFNKAPVEDKGIEMERVLSEKVVQTKKMLNKEHFTQSIPPEDDAQAVKSDESDKSDPMCQIHGRTIPQRAVQAEEPRVLSREQFIHAHVVSKSQVRRSKSNGFDKGNRQKSSESKEYLRKGKKIHLPSSHSSTERGLGEMDSFGSAFNGTTSTAETPTTSTYPTPTLIPCTCCKIPTLSTRLTTLSYGQDDYRYCRSCVRKKPILSQVCCSEEPCECYDIEPVKLTLESTTVDCYCMCPDPSKLIQSDRCGRCNCRVKSMRAPQEYCTCTKPSRLRHSQYCAHCQNRLRKTSKCRNGIAYTLTLEEETPGKYKSKKRKKNKLEEIRVKIPSKYDRKKYKDEQNLTKKGKYSEDETNSRLDSGSKEREVKLRSYLTLQEHLRKNRPDFIDSAEYRRIAVLNSKIGRELIKDEEKLKLLEENIDSNNKLQRQNKLFSEKEMREITKRNYKKLPEVQNRLHNYKEQKLRNADKLMASVLTKKIQGSILKGKSRFPIDSKLVNLNK